MVTQLPRPHLVSRASKCWEEWTPPPCASCHSAMDEVLCFQTLNFENVSDLQLLKVVLLMIMGLTTLVSKLKMTGRSLIV
jgi:hypothetical protein